MCSAERWTQGRRGRGICMGERAEAETGDGGTGVQEKKFLVPKESTRADGKAIFAQGGFMVSP